MKLITRSTLFILSMAYLLLPMAVARPVQAKNINHNPESAAMKRNGPLPSGLEQKDRLAMNATSYPASVAEALTKGATADGARVATDAEIKLHKFYTTLSASSYCRDVIPGGKFECKHCDPSLTLIKTFTTTVDDTNAMILRGDSQKTIYLVFRGTNSIRSAIVDIVFVPVDYPIANGTKVHKGFLDSYNSVRDDLFKILDEQINKYPEYKVVATGHSLGGAQAVLCVLDLLNTNSTRYSTDTLSLFTQGQPRVGDPAFANYLFSSNIPYERIVNNRDIVPHLPPGDWNFLHAGEELWITSDSVQVCPNGIETDNCANSIVPFTSFLDHLSYFDINTGLCL